MIKDIRPKPDYETIKVGLYEETFEDREDLVEFLKSQDKKYGDEVEFEVYYFMYGEDDVDVVDVKYKGETVWLELNEALVREEFSDQHWRLFT